MVAGTGVHRGAEKNEVQKVATRCDLPASEIVEAAVEAFRAEVSGGGVVEETMHTGSVLKDLKSDGLDRTARLAGLYATAVAPTYQPAAVELPLTITCGEIEINMIIDTVTDDDVIRDRKTVGATPPAGMAANAWQLSANAAGFYATYGRMPKAVAFDALVDLKTPKYVESRATRELSDVQAVLDRVIEYDRAISAGIFLPTTNTQMVCAPHLCGYYATCKYVAKARG